MSLYVARVSCASRLGWFPGSFFAHDDPAGPYSTSIAVDHMFGELTSDCTAWVESPALSASASPSPKVATVFWSAEVRTWNRSA